MKISRRFKIEENEGNGELGFLPLWIKGADPMQNVAHDMLEHFLVPQCNAAEAELMALGALLVIRIDGNRNMPAEQNLALAIESAMTDWVCDDHDDPRPLQTYRTREHGWADAVITLAVPKAFAGHRRNFSDIDPSPFDNQLQLTVVSWLRAGVRAAHRRYYRANTDLYTLGDYVFKKLNDFSQRLIDVHELQGGDSVVITADVDACEFMATANGRRL